MPVIDFEKGAVRAKFSDNCWMCKRKADFVVGAIRNSKSSLYKTYRATGTPWCFACRDAHTKQCEDRLAHDLAERNRFKAIREQKRKDGVPVTDEDYYDS